MWPFGGYRRYVIGCRYIEDWKVRDYIAGLLQIDLPHKGPVMRSFDVFFVVHLQKRGIEDRTEGYRPCDFSLNMIVKTLKV